MPYKITKDVASEKILKCVSTDSQFSKHIHEIFAAKVPTRIIETGTYHGTGTTAIIGSAIRAANIEHAEFFSIEVNPVCVSRALQNIEQQGINVRLMQGLSIPRELLLSKQQIEQQYVSTVHDGLYVDWHDAERAEGYFRETNYANSPDDLLGKLLAYFDYQPDFLLLDSAGHLGNIEFQYVIAKLRGPCVIALDDTRHVKHFRSVEQLKSDPRFRVIAEGEEKFGFCIAQFTG